MQRETETRTDEYSDIAVRQGLATIHPILGILSILSGKIFLAAIKNGHVETVKYLIALGVDINQIDESGDFKPPLALALMHNRMEIADLLFKAGGYNSMLDNLSFYEVLRLCRANIVEILAKNEADVNVISNKDTPIILPTQDDRAKIIIEFLVKRVADVNKGDKYGNTLLILAVQGGYADIVKFLVENGADVNKCDPFGEKPIIFAVRAGRADIVEILARYKADLNKCYIDTPLTLAVKYGHADIVEILARYKADLNKHDMSGDTPLTLAVKAGRADIVEILARYKADLNEASLDDDIPLTLAVKAGRADIVEILARYGADFNKADKNGVTPIWLITYVGESQIAKFLIKNGAAKSIDDSILASIITNCISRGYQNEAKILIATIINKTTEVDSNISAEWLRLALKRYNMEEVAAMAMLCQPNIPSYIDQESGNFKKAKKIADEMLLAGAKKLFSSFLLGTHKRLGANSGVLMLYQDVLEITLKELIKESRPSSSIMKAAIEETASLREEGRG